MGNIELQWRSSMSRRRALVSLATLFAGSPLLRAQQDTAPLKDHRRAPSLREMVTAFDFEPIFRVYAQDQWTRGKLTLNLGVRFDHTREYAPAQHEAANLFVGPRDFPKLDNVPLFNDVAPRLGAASDVFGDGKTAIKASLGGYVVAESARLAQLVAPAAKTAGAATRTWTDANRNYVPDCDLTNPFANGECGKLSNLNLGLTVPSTNYADQVLHGFGVRPYTWQGALSVQHELRSGMALNVGYYRTWYRNFTATANQAVAPGDFDSYCITTPSDLQLGAASGSAICGLFDVTPGKFGQVSNLVQPASNFGTQYEHYNGIDGSLNARFGHGGLLVGGVSTGQTVTDTCGVVQTNPQIALTVNGGTASRSSTAFCHVVLPWSAQTQFKFAGTYPLPWWGLQTSATLQNLAGIPIFANYVATNAQIAPSLGRNLAAGAAGTATIALLVPNTLFEDRLNQFDVRLTKIIRVGRARLQGRFDVYNLFNASTVLNENFTYGPSWRKPSSILGARLVKLGAQLDF